MSPFQGTSPSGSGPGKWSLRLSLSLFFPGATFLVGINTFCVTFWVWLFWVCGNKSKQHEYEVLWEKKILHHLRNITQKFYTPALTVWHLSTGLVYGLIPISASQRNQVILDEVYIQRKEPRRNLNPSLPILFFHQSRKCSNYIIALTEYLLLYFSVLYKGDIP